MNIPDIINSIFVFSASFFIWLNVYRVVRDKAVQGVSLISMTFFSVWGCWQIFYFWNLGEFWTVVATILLALANVVWFATALYYSRRSR